MMFGDDKSKEIFLQAQGLAKAPDLACFKREHRQYVVAIAVFLDRVSEPPLAPTVRRLDGAAVLGHALMDTVERRLDRVFLEVRTKNCDDLIIRQYYSHPS